MHFMEAIMYDVKTFITIGIVSLIVLLYLGSLIYDLSKEIDKNMNNNFEPKDI